MPQYVELSNVGHCPNHEAPNAVASILQLFWKQPEGPILSGPVEVKERWGVMRVTQKSKVPLNWIEKQILSKQ